MRSLTNSEREWLSKFDRSYKDKKGNARSYRSDTMNKVRVNLDRIDEHGEVTPFHENMDAVVNTVPQFSPLDKDKEDMQPRTRPIKDANVYTASDYYALPSLWYSGNWTNLMCNSIDKDRGLSDEDDTGVPGIIKQDNFYKVSSFFECQNVQIGIYKTFEAAKSALIKYNKTVTFRGYGVDKE